MNWRATARAGARILIARRRTALAIGFSFFFGAMYAIYAASLQYEARATVALSPRAGVPSVEAIELSLPRHAAAISSRGSIESAADAVGIPVGDAARDLEIITVPDAVTMTIVARLADPTLAADLANRLADRALDVAAKDPLVQGELVAAAVPSERAAVPARLDLALAALGAGIVIGGSAGLANERISPRVRTPREIETATDLTYLGAIPLHRTLRVRPERAFEDPAIAAAARILRPYAGSAGGVIAVVGGTHGEGATTLAALFAESLARAGDDVLLVDADLRAADLSGRFGLDPQPGLTGVLQHGIPLPAAIRRGWTERLHVLATKSDRAAADLFATRLQDVVAAARATGMTVILDSPPLSVAEGRLVTGAASAALLCVRFGTSPADATAAGTAVQDVARHVVGVVANAQPLLLGRAL